MKVINTTDVKDNYLPKDYTLNQNYPNPFNPSTTISYALPKTSFVTLRIYDMLGREIKTLVNNQQNAGTNMVQWNGDNNFGTKVSSGTYIYVIRADEFYSAKKMVLLK